MTTEFHTTGVQSYSAQSLDSSWPVPTRPLLVTHEIDVEGHDKQKRSFVRDESNPVVVDLRISCLRKLCMSDISVPCETCVSLSRKRTL